ncbi:DUF1611 domain-containing protein [Novosphingobium aerophilum]|uniref:DUF1611 domain-containing protein n=1 Tax=Novosphingobium TaxID=165696 RepID=UPI0012CDEF7B|nr:MULTISPECIES: DUF1611 domain-containing protein [unclassified Novosphingobium]MPS70180.1 DUF1611 domain-containing protein [Novosphingobium sp.]WRT94844.1 DUF1611 domain-containing protein [Novosphingobium sp. RL4]
MISGPFLLYIGDKRNPLDVKTSRGLAAFRPQDCIGELREPDGPLSLGLPCMTVEQAAAAGARALVLGIATSGGRLEEAMIPHILAALDAGLDVVSGLHQHLGEDARVRERAAALGRRLIDVRAAPAGLKVGNGARRSGRRLLTVGTDCAVGKMYTSLHLVAAMNARGLPARFRATGQTGILIAGEGVAIDCVIADFISGAAEALSPAREDTVWDVIEGQGSLFNPSFAGVSLGLLHGAQPQALVLCHEAARPHIRGLPHMPVPDLKACLEENLRCARLTSPSVEAVGVSINGSGLAPEDAADFRARIEDDLGLPCVDPLVTGMDALVDRIAAGSWA